MTAPRERTSLFGASTLLACLVLGSTVLWSYWTTLASVAFRWSIDPQYSHGWLVPVFAAYLLWLHRDKLAGQPTGFNYLGLVAIVGALSVRLAGTHYHFEYLDQISLLPCLAGIFLLAGSWRALAWSLPAIAFLAFMIPLPHSVSLAVSGPMQALATTASTFVLQVMGRPAVAEGNIILLNDIELGIVEACSGLRMLVVFFALSTGVSMLSRQPLWEKVLIAFSAIPIALISNILRIVVTGLCYDFLGNHFGGAFFHDLAGWLMMPLGLAFLGVEWWILRNLLLERQYGGSASLAGNSPVAEFNPIALYHAKASSRRKKAPLTPAIAEEVPVEAAASQT